MTINPLLCASIALGNDPGTEDPGTAGRSAYGNAAFAAGATLFALNFASTTISLTYNILNYVYMQ